MSETVREDCWHVSGVKQIGGGWWSAGQTGVTSIQDARMRERLADLELTAAAAAAAPAYADRARALCLVRNWSDLDRLGCVRKEDLRADATAFLTGDPGVRIHCTSGSTGEPAYVVYGTEEVQSITRRAARTMQLAGVSPGSAVLNLFGYGTFVAGHLYDWGATAFGAMVIPFGSASMTPPARTAAAIRSLRPHVVNGVPSYLVKFLGELRDRSWPGLDEIRIAQCAGEVMTPALRERLLGVLGPGAAVFDQYGMTEFGPIAAECAAHDGMHLLDHGLHIEVLDDRGTAVTDGEGELVVTSLKNRAMALVRYRTGDWVEVSGDRCRCGDEGRRIRVLRRTDDLTKIRGVLCSKQEIVDAVRSVEGVDQFHVVIARDESFADRLEVMVSPGSNGASANGDLATLVRERVRERVRFAPDRIEVLEQVEVPRTLSGKPRFIVDTRQDA